MLACSGYFTLGFSRSRNMPTPCVPSSSPKCSPVLSPGHGSSAFVLHVLVKSCREHLRSMILCRSVLVRVETGRLICGLQLSTMLHWKFPLSTWMQFFGILLFHSSMTCRWFLPTACPYYACGHHTPNTIHKILWIALRHTLSTLSFE